MGERFLFSELLRHKEQSKPSHRSVLSKLWYYIVSGNRKGEAGNELYDIEKDLGGTADRSKQFPEIAERLHRKFEDLALNEGNVAPQEVNIPLDDETIERLKTLGYVE